MEKENGTRPLKLVEDPLNRRGREIVKGLAEETRRALVQHIFDVFKENILAERDPELKKRLEEKYKTGLSGHPSGLDGSPFEIYLVTIDSQVVPDVDGVPPGCFAIHLERNDDLGQEDDDDRITVYMPPNPPDFSIEDGDIDTLKPPDVVFVKIEDGKGKIARYSIDRDIVFSYTIVGDQKGVGRGVEDDSYDLDKLLRVDTGWPELSKLFQDVLNMKVVPLIKSVE